MLDDANDEASMFFKFGIPELAKRISRQKLVKCLFPIRYGTQVGLSDLNPTLILNLTLTQP